MQMLMLYFQVTTTINQALIVHAGSKLGALWPSISERKAASTILSQQKRDMEQQYLSDI